MSDLAPDDSQVPFIPSELPCPACGAAVLLCDQVQGAPLVCPACHVVLWCRKRDQRDVVFLDVLTTPRAEISDVARVAQSLLRPRAARGVVVNLRGVQRLDSSFVAGLLVMRRMLALAGCKLVLCELTPNVQSLLQRLNLHTLFEIRSGEQEGLMAV